MLLVLAIGLISCRKGSRRTDSTVVFLIESSPTSLDPRVGVDAQSEHIQELLFDGLVERDSNFHVTAGLASSWNQPDPLTIIFHLRQDVHFSDGRLMTSRDVVWTLDSMRDGTIVTPKGGSYASVDSISAPDSSTVILHLKRPDNFLLLNLASGAMGIVPDQSGRDFWMHPVGTGAFRLLSQEVDKEVVIERNPRSWSAGPVGGQNGRTIERVRFAVVPDATTRALELENGSADIASNSILADMLPVLAARKNLAIESTAGTQLQYLGLNMLDPALSDVRVRQAIACSIDRELIMKTLLAGRAQLAASLLPQQHWAWSGDVDRYDYDPSRATRLLESAGHRADARGVRLRLTMKTSTDEGTRMLAAILQQQLKASGIALEIRSFEPATFLQDLTRGSFQMYGLRWVGGNESPEIFGYAFSTARIPPKGANRSRYRNSELDRLLNDAAMSLETDRRKADYRQVQQILARDLPAIDMWYPNSTLVHSRRITNVAASPSGSFAFLRTAAVMAPLP